MAISKFVLAIAVSFVYSIHARADWADLGVSWRCNKKTATFSLRPLVNTSSGQMVPMEPGFTKIIDGYHNAPPYTTTLQCNLPGARAKAIVYAREDSYQLSLWINSEIVFKNALFNSGFGFEPVPYKVDVQSHGRRAKPSIAVCMGNWTWDDNYKNGKCEAVRPVSW